LFGFFCGQQRGKKGQNSPGIPKKTIPRGRFLTILRKRKKGWQGKGNPKTNWSGPLQAPDVFFGPTTLCKKASWGLKIEQKRMVGGALTWWCNTDGSPKTVRGIRSPIKLGGEGGSHPWVFVGRGENDPWKMVELPNKSREQTVPPLKKKKKIRRIKTAEWSPQHCRQKFSPTQQKKVDGRRDPSLANKQGQGRLFVLQRFPLCVDREKGTINMKRFVQNQRIGFKMVR